MQALVSLNHRLLISNYHSLRGSVTQRTGEFFMHNYNYIKCILLKFLVCQRIKNSISHKTLGIKIILFSNHTQSNTVKPLLWPFFLVSADSQYITIIFYLSTKTVCDAGYTTATYLSAAVIWQLELVLTVKITSRQWPVN